MKGPLLFIEELELREAPKSLEGTHAHSHTYKIMNGNSMGSVNLAEFPSNPKRSAV